MFKTPRCCVTAKDYAILASMVARTPPYGDRLLRLLRRKLSMAIVVLPEDVAPDVATLNSHLDYRIDGGRSQACVLVQEAGDAGLALPISTLRGLALLGLSAGESITLEKADGRVETLSLETVAYQPESARRTEGFTASARGTTLVNLRHYATSRMRSSNGPVGLEDDDGGPPAA